jgi:hypothetical protein
LLQPVSSIGAMSTPTILIAARKWPVPLFAPRQNRIIVPAMMNLGARPETRYEELLDIIFTALGRADPGLDRGEFEDLPIATWEMLEALPTIARQTGLLKSGKPSHIADKPPDWDRIIAQFCNFLPGTTPDYWEDALTIPRLEAMNEEWRLHPPVAALIAAYLGYKPKPRNSDAVEELLRLFPTGKLRLN